MKTKLALIALAFTCALNAQEVLNTANTSMVVNARPGSELMISYYGPRLNEADAANLMAAGLRPQRAYPAHGLIGKEEEAISVIFPDGNMTLKLQVSAVSSENWENGRILKVESRDTH